MALLIFTQDSNPPPQLAGLLDTELRQTVAARVNEELLRGQGCQSQTKLKSLVKLRAWAEKRAREQGRDIPEYLDIWGAPPCAAEDTEMGQDGGAEPMAT